MRHTILACLFAAFALPARADLPLETGDITLPVQLVRDGRTSTLLPNKTLDEGDIVKTGDRASVSMYFVRDGMITLGSDSQVFVHSASPASMGRGEVLRLQLLRGELTLESYPASNTIAKDYRLNVGVLQVRALGADLWAFTNSEGEAVCLHQGAVEITGGAGEQRLDMAGQCAQHLNNGSLKIVEDSEIDLKNRLLAAEKRAVDAAISSGPSANAAPPLVAPIRTSAPASHQSEKAELHWVVVVATARNSAAADLISAKLRRKNLRSTIRDTGKAPTPFSVTFGNFPTRKEANEAAQTLQHKYHLSIVRVAALS